MIAAIIRDFRGVILGAKVKKIDVVDPLEGEAEAKAAKLGLELVHFQGFREVILEEDSELVIKAIRNWPQISEWRILSLVQEIHDMCCRLHSWQAFSCL